MSERHAKLLDCTLRDGAYLIDKRFGDEYINGIIRGLIDADVDIIEIGFFQDEGFGEGKTVFKNGRDARKFIPDDKGNTMFTVLADFSRYSASNLDECTGDSVDAVRACFFKKERKDVLEFCREIKRKGYKLFVQPVDILGYSDTELIDLLNDINEIEPYCLSIVDTFGSMYVEDLHRVFSLIDHNLVQSSLIGFHSHNNMQMSSALSQEFLRLSYGLRKVIVDATISGMGRGAGNCSMENLMGFLRNPKFNIYPVLQFIEKHILPLKQNGIVWGYDLQYLMTGILNQHPRTAIAFTNDGRKDYTEFYKEVVIQD